MRRLVIAVLVMLTACLVFSFAGCTNCEEDDGGGTGGGCGTIIPDASTK